MSMREPVWHVITGEYPPQRGGVSDYTGQLAAALVRDGAEVHVWCPPADGADAEMGGVVIHRLGSRFDRAAIAQLDRGLDASPGPRRLLVQYAPNAFGARGLNLRFCHWLATRTAVDDVRVMFHEPYFYFTRRRPQRNILAIGQRLMAVLLLKASRVVYLSSATWRRYLGVYQWFGRRPFVTLPIPSTIPVDVDAPAVARLRHELLGGEPDACLVGHFGTHEGLGTSVLRGVVARLLAHSAAARMLCVGANSDRFVEELVAGRPALGGRVSGRGRLGAGELSHHLQACDLAVQPYPDGVTTRRTTLMAMLAHGVPTVTTGGPLTEALWSAGRVVRLAPAGDVEAIVEAAVELLDHPDARRAQARRGLAYYDGQLSMARVVERLRAAPEPNVVADLPVVRT